MTCKSPRTHHVMTGVDASQITTLVTLYNSL